MDPSIMNLLDDDEDESMHSGAAVDAFTAALNRHIEEGPSGAVTQSSEADTAGELSQDNSSDPMQLPGNWDSSATEKLGQQSQQKEQLDSQPPEEHSSQTEQIDSAKDQHQHISNQSERDQQIVQVEQSHSDHQQRQTETDPFQIVGKDKAPEQNTVPDSKLDMPQHSESQRQPAMQQLNNQQAAGANDANTSLRRPKPAPSIPFHMLIPILRPNLDKDRAMQLSSVFSKLRGNEISKEDFLRVIRNIVGDQMLRQAAHKVQMQIQAEAARDAQTNTNQYSLQAQAASHQLSSRGAQFTEPQVFPPPHPTSSQNQKGHKSPPRQPHVPPPAVQMQTGREFPNLEHKQDGKGMHTTQIYSTNMVNPERQNMSVPLSANKQQHGQLPQTSFPMYGNTGGNFHTYPRPPISAGGTSMETRGASQLTNVMPKYEPQNTTENKRLHSHLPSQKNSLAWQPSSNKELNNAFPSMGYVKQEAVDHAAEHFQSSRMGFSTHPDTAMQHSHGSSVTQPFVAGIPAKTPQKKPLVGQKKPLETGGTSSPLSSKKQKTSGAFLDQSIEQLNDVTAVSGVNLREEEEQLLSAPKEDSRASEATRRVVQEEEERLILQKGALQKKLLDIMSKCGLEGFGSDVERCLSLCVEERLRGLISNLIRVSKQRVDTEKTRHKHVCTSDVGRHIKQVNKEAKQEDDKKQAEAEKLRKLNDSEDTGPEAEKEKDESRSKTVKVNREEDDKMRTTAANVAARAAVGGDDMLSKWQLMAERAKHKRDGVDVGSTSQPSKTTIRKTVPTFSRSLRAQQETEKRGSSAGGTRKAGRSQAAAPHARVACSITVKDVISVLEREPQTSKSELIYRLYDRLASAAD